MKNAFFEECKERFFQYFPERQLYLRSGGEVRYFVFSTRLQIGMFFGLCLISLWCFITFINVVWNLNPLRASTDQVRQKQVKISTLIADAELREQRLQNLLETERARFAQATRQFEEKHATLSQFMDGDISKVPAEVHDNQAYADANILMSPVIRDVIPRQARRNYIRLSQIETGTAVDSDYREIDDLQNRFLLSVENETIDRIERNRAILAMTELNVDDFLQKNTRGQGGPLVSLSNGAETELTEVDIRLNSIRARIYEVDMLDAAMRAIPMSQPIEVEHFLTSAYGSRKDPFTRRPSFHEGMDISSYHKAPILATADGVVSFVGRKGGFGRVIEIDHGYGFKTLYAHLAKAYVKRGQKVEKGHKIGGMGSTGRSTSTHLHYEVHFEGRVYNPAAFMKAGQYVQ